MLISDTEKVIKNTTDQFSLVIKEDMEVEDLYTHILMLNIEEEEVVELMLINILLEDMHMVEMLMLDHIIDEIIFTIFIICIEINKNFI